MNVINVHGEKVKDTIVITVLIHS